eukprot:scaffold23013_cov64-Cyclotella_meneghiniana.AAC.1
MLQSASNVTSVSEGDEIAVAIDLRLQFSADTTKHLASNRCTKLQIPLHSMSLPETAHFVLTSMANKIQFSSQSWYDSHSCHDSFRLIIFESTRQSRDLPVSIAATEKLTPFVGHLTEDYDMASKFTSLSTTDNDPSQSDETGGQFRYAPFMFDVGPIDGTAGHHFCIFVHSFDAHQSGCVSIRLDTKLEAEDTTASQSFAIAQNGGLIFNDLFFSVAAFVQNRFGIDVNGGATILSFSDLVGNWSTRAKSYVDLYLAHESVLLSPTLAAGARGDSKTLSSTSVANRKDTALQQFMFFKVPHFLARTKTTTLCEGDVQAALDDILRKQLRNSDESESESNISHPTHSGILQLGKSNLQLVDYVYASIWWMQLFNIYVTMVYEISSRQQETILTRHGVHSFHAPCPTSIHPQQNLDLTLISEGDLKLFSRASFRNLRQSSLLVTTKMYSQMDLQNKNQNGLPESVPALRIMLESCKPIDIVSEGDSLHSLLYQLGPELVVTMYLEIRRDVSFLHAQIESENCNACWQTRHDLLLSLTIVKNAVSEGDVLMYEATCSHELIRVQSFVTIVMVHNFVHEHRSRYSIFFTCDIIESDRNKLQLAEQIQRNVIFDCKQLQQKSWQYESTIADESIRKHIESTVMVDTAILPLTHRSSAATQQSTVYSYAYLFSQSNRHASSIVLSLQRNSWCYPDGWMVQVQVLVLALVAKCHLSYVAT